MDPLLVLPTELLHHIVLLLPPGDRVRLFELSRDWRDFVFDPSLWWRVVLNLDDGADSLRVLLRAPCVDTVVVGADASVLHEMNTVKLRRAFRSGILIRKVESFVCFGGLHEDNNHLCSVLAGLSTAGLEELSLAAQPPCLGVVARMESLRKLGLTLPRGVLEQSPLMLNLNAHPAIRDSVFRIDQRERRNRPKLALPAQLEDLKLHGATVDLNVDLSALRRLHSLEIDCASGLHFSLPPNVEHLVLLHAHRHHLESVVKLRWQPQSLVVQGFVGEPDGVRDLVVPQDWSLQVLILAKLPEATMLSFVRTFSPALNCLCLTSEVEVDEESYIDDLGSKLRAACDLDKLKVVSFLRREEPHLHDAVLCQAQLKQIRRALEEKVEVSCFKCTSD